MKRKQAKNCKHRNATALKAWDYVWQVKIYWLWCPKCGALKWQDGGTWRHPTHIKEPSK